MRCRRASCCRAARRMVNVSAELENIDFGRVVEHWLTDPSAGRRLQVGAHFFSLVSARRCRLRPPCVRTRALPLHAAARPALSLLSSCRLLLMLLVCTARLARRGVAGAGGAAGGGDGGAGTAAVPAEAWRAAVDRRAVVSLIEMLSLNDSPTQAAGDGEAARAPRRDRVRAVPILAGVTLAC